MNNVTLSNEIRDVKPPVDWPESFLWPWGILLIMGTLILTGSLCWWLYQKRKLKALSLKSKTPWELAHERLRSLEQNGLGTLEELKAFYVALSAIVRRYMEERFAIRAPEMTTEEFLNYLRASPDLNPQQKETFKNFLNACDMVKFARYGPTEKEARESLLLAKKLVDETAV